MLQAPLTFPGIREDEIVLEIIHKHWFPYAWIFIRLAVYVGLVIGLFYLLSDLFDASSRAYLALIFLVVLLAIWFWFFVRFLDEELDCLILTNERLIDITQTGLFSISFSETSLDLIQNVRGSVTGFISNILHYGTINIQTAARSDALEMEYVARPVECSQKILNEKEKFLEIHGGRKEETPEDF